MLVARFGPTTAWEGREIIWDVDHFILVGHGAVPAAGVVDYDRRGQLIWPDPALRPWVYEVDRWERSRGASPAAGPATAGPAAASGRRGRVPAWVIVVAAVGGLALIAAVVLAAALPSLLTQAKDSLTDEVVVRAGVLTVQSGIEAYADGHGGRFPPAGEVNPIGLGAYVPAWPQNPYTGLPMLDGGGEGNYRYDLSPDGGAYRLIGYGGGGSVVIELSGGSASTV